MVKHLYGRESDIALINGLIDGVGDGGAALMIGGDPGMGKSALLEAARELATDRGMRVLYLCGVPSETHLPFGALQQAMGSILKEVDTLPGRRRSTRLALQIVQDTEESHAFFRYLTAVIGVQIVQLAPGVGHAAHLDHTSIEQSLVAGVVVTDELA